jgi:murein L,D-transpeptidase YafK
MRASSARALWSRTPPPHEPCPATGKLVLVDSRAGVLSLCRDGRERRWFRVAVGRNGTGKRVEGDGRTPLGAYSLGPSRRSRRYHLFVPVGYPSADQRQAGFSGGDIGIHGPHLAFSWLGHATAWLDWTRGCIALGTRSEIEDVARWLADSETREILIR